MLTLIRCWASAFPRSLASGAAARSLPLMGNLFCAAGFIGELLPSSHSTQRGNRKDCTFVFCAVWMDRGSSPGRAPHGGAGTARSPSPHPQSRDEEHSETGITRPGLEGGETNSPPYRVVRFPSQR